ncbi:MAG: hypothetical protein U1F43_38260 [Myxococcota bacterium]
MVASRLGNGVDCDPARGVLVASALDCDGQGLAEGALVLGEAGSARLVYSDGLGCRVDPAASGLDGCGVVYAADLPSGRDAVSVESGDLTLGGPSVVVEDRGVVVVAPLRP